MKNLKILASFIESFLLKEKSAWKKRKIENPVDVFKIAEKLAQSPPEVFIRFHTLEKIGISPEPASSATPSGIFAWALTPEIFKRWKETEKTDFGDGLKFATAENVSILSPKGKVWNLTNPADPNDLKIVKNWIESLINETINFYLEDVPEEYHHFVYDFVKSGGRLSGIKPFELIKKIKNDIKLSFLQKKIDEEEIDDQVNEISQKIHNAIEKTDMILRIVHYGFEKISTGGDLYKFIHNLIKEMPTWRSKRLSTGTKETAVHRWNAFLRNILGYDVIYDGGGDAIYSREPFQAIFLSVKSFDVIGTYSNPTKERTRHHINKRKRRI